MKVTKLFTSLAALVLVLGLGSCQLESEDDTTDETESSEIIGCQEQEHEHTLGEWISDENGHYRICQECGEKVDEGSHSYPSAYTLDDEDGRYHSKTCIDCGYKVKEAHQVSDDEGNCINCSATGLNTAGLTYELTPYEPDYEDPDYDEDYEPDPTYYVSSYDMSLTAHELYIPATHDGIPVVAIGGEGSSNAPFEGSTSQSNYLQFVSIPDSVTALNSNAFKNCYSLETIELGNGVTTLEDNSFYQCFALYEIHIPSNVVSVKYRSFYECYSLRYVTFEEGLKSLGDEVFYNDYALESVDLPESLTEMGQKIFYYCYSLTSVTLPSHITTLPQYMFYYCMSLREVELPDTLEVLDEHCFQYCTALEYIDLPSGLTTINGTAFSTCRSLKFVDIPEGVEEIGGTSAFATCQALSAVVIPSSMGKIGGQTFQNDYALATVYYGGSNEEEWNNITYTESTNKFLATAVRYYYSEEEPTEEGNYWHYDANGIVTEW